MDAGQVVIVLRDIGAGIEDGDTIVYTGGCEGGQMHWQVTGTAPAKYHPRT